MATAAVHEVQLDDLLAAGAGDGWPDARARPPNGDLALSPMANAAGHACDEGGCGNQLGSAGEEEEEERGSMAAWLAVLGLLTLPAVGLRLALVHRSINPGHEYQMKPK